MGVRTWWQRVTTPEVRRVPEPHPVASPTHDAQPVASCQDRQKVRVTGTITSVERELGEGSPAVVAELDDGSGRMRVIWMGRREIPGIEPGTKLTVSGRIVADGDHRVMFNPGYELGCSRS